MVRAGSEGARVNSVEEGFAVADTYAVLFDLDAAAAFVAAVRSESAPRIAYVVTYYETQFQVVAGQLPHSVEPVRLDAADLDNFRIQAGRDVQFKLKDYQEDAVAKVLRRLADARDDYRSKDRLVAFALSAITGAGKTVMASAVFEALFDGSEEFEVDADPTGGHPVGD